MTSADLILLIVALTVEFVVGIALNLHILIVYTGNLKNGLSLGPSDKVHLTKALVNIFLHLTMAAKNICAFWPNWFYTNEVFLWITINIMFSIFYSYWLTAVLCVYYCTSITTSGHHCIAWLKMSLSSYLLPILFISGLGSFAICCPTFWFSRIKRIGNSTYQSTARRETFLQEVTYRATVSILGCFLPFTIALISTTFTARSLIIHMWRMKKNNGGFTRSKFQTQINAMRTMVLFLLISIIYSITQMLFFALPLDISDAVVTMIFMVMLSYSISEAVIIIQSSSKLRKTLLGNIFGRKRNSETET